VEPGLHLTGPSLAGIWGRQGGTVPGFRRYSTALERAAVTWDAPTLDRWLERPEAVDLKRFLVERCEGEPR
jgi:cytochrome c